MEDGIESRLIIHKTLKLIKIKSINFDEAFLIASKEKSLDIINKKFIYNTILTTLRYHLLIDKIIKNLVNKLKDNSDSYLLLLSSISQILFLNIKSYAVVNSSVELSKNKQIKSVPNFINACLRNFLRKQKYYLNFKLDYENLPNWFVKETKNLHKNQKLNFLKNIYEQPTLHIVLKNKINLKNYLHLGKKTSENSFAVNSKYNLSDIPNYNKGEWWVQDFSSMIPINLIDIDKSEIIADIGSAPGGKLFQLMSKNQNITSFEKNKKRFNKLNENLTRLKLKININIEDFLQSKVKKKYDLIILDAPCSSIGTVRKNPEIFFKKRIPNLEYLIKYQYALLQKCTDHLKKNGSIIYMVCSFLEIETTKQINKFLQNNQNYIVDKFKINKNNLAKNFITENNFILTLPKKIMNNIKVDGYFACKLFKTND